MKAVAVFPVFPESFQKSVSLSFHEVAILVMHTLFYLCLIFAREIEFCSRLASEAHSRLSCVSCAATVSFPCHCLCVVNFQSLNYDDEMIIFNLCSGGALVSCRATLSYKNFFNSLTYFLLFIASFSFLFSKRSNKGCDEQRGQALTSYLWRITFAILLSKYDTIIINGVM